MEPATLLRALSVGMKAKVGYDRLNSGNLNPRINTAAAETAEAFDNLTVDHFYAAIRSDDLAEIFRVSDGRTAAERFAAVLRDEVVDPDIDADFHDAALEFLDNLDREIAENDEILWRQLQSHKLDAITGYIRDHHLSDRECTSTDDIHEFVEPLDSVFSHFTSEVDQGLLEPVRALDNLDQRQAEEVFESVMKQKIREKTGIGFDRFQRALESKNLFFLDTESIDADLTIEIADRFQSLEFVTGTGSLNERLMVDEPELLWDCSCTFSSSADCAIHSKSNAKAISREFGGGYVQISYRGINVIWRDSQYFWPPSVDTIYMIENLLDAGIHEHPAASICEVGCGTSMMGLVLGMMNEDITQMYVTDWLLTPLIFSRINWELNADSFGGRDISFTPVLGYGSYWVGHVPPNEAEIDQVFCNPPYLPDLGVFDSVREQHTVGGTALLELLIEDGGEFADTVFINFSDIAMPEAREAERRSSASLERVGTTHTVPFRVPQALESREYMEHLVGDRDLQVREDSRYPFWHDITTYRLEFR